MTRRRLAQGVFLIYDSSPEVSARNSRDHRARLSFSIPMRNRTRSRSGKRKNGKRTADELSVKTLANARKRFSHASRAFSPREEITFEDIAFSLSTGNPSEPLPREFLLFAPKLRASEGRERYRSDTALFPPVASVTRVSQEFPCLIARVELRAQAKTPVDQRTFVAAPSRAPVRSRPEPTRHERLEFMELFRTGI